ncbi:MAG: hypothetical protein FJW32_29685 [Acidobacteria bacterium]|nr:hypothetical protein [Acidobacteriota bacterium]
MLFERGSTAQQAAALLGLSSAGTVPIGGREVCIELRAADDFHIDPNWAREIMASCVWAGPVCRIDAENLFFLSAYELRLSEGPIARPKAELLAELALRACISDATVDDFLDDARLAQLLTDWFRGKEYHLTYPDADSAFDSGFAAQIVAPFLLPSRSNLYRDLKSNGLDQRNLIERYVQFEKNFMSRAFLFRMLIKRTFGL